MLSSDDPNVDFYLEALRAEGRDPMVVPMSVYRTLDGERDTTDFLVLQDDTYERWIEP